MCGRFTTRLTPAELIEAFGLAGVDPTLLESLPPRFNVAPRQPVPVISNQAPRLLQAFRWGLVPWWAKDSRGGDRLINARLETLEERRAFASGERHRCLVLADGFFEWKRGGQHKQPFFFELSGSAPFAFAGLWDRWRSPSGDTVHSCVLVTQPAVGEVAAVHNRMPVVLPKRLYPEWLAPGAVPLGSWAQRLGSLAPPFLARPVSTYVNSAAHEGPECLLPPPPA
ncbi:MAG: SOS response-associated peptidase [Myxococcaceae bacterium]